MRFFLFYFERQSLNVKSQMAANKARAKAKQKAKKKALQAKKEGDAKARAEFVSTNSTEHSPTL